MTSSLLSLSPARLRCEALTDPLAIDHPRPRLSWIVESDARNQRQTAYEILAASSPELLAQDRGDLWSSGKVASDETIDIEYDGIALAPAQRCWWKLRVWDGVDRASAWSAPATFGAGLQQSDWQAEWVGFDRRRDLDLPPGPFDGASWIWIDDAAASQRVGVFIGTLYLPDDVTVVDSQLAITAAGRYRFFWGAEQFATSDDEPEPWRRPYIRPMTERLHPGANHFVIKAEQIDDQPPGVLCKLTVRASDGRTFALVSDTSWRAMDAVVDDWQTASRSDDWPACRVVAKYGQAPWGIIYGVDNFLPPPAYLHGTFSVDQPIRHATLFATALGAYDLHLNGARVNDSYFDPGWTDYHKRLYYRGYDVTAVLRAGENAWGAILADGWFSGYIGWYHQRDIYGKHVRFRGQLHIEYADGTTQISGTDASWKAALGPIKEADMLMGEVYDARDELAGWATAGFDASHWQPVDLGTAITPLLQPHPAPPVVALDAERFVPRAITEPAPGVFIFDLGQNFAGIARLRLHNTAAGQRILLRFGEMLNADGTLYTRNLRTARATDTYICRGDAEETWSPRFTFHGFRYVEVTGLISRPDADTITGIPLSTNTPLVGSFACSDALANRLAQNVYWSQRSNFIEIPIDCPQRDERLGWCDAAWTFVGAGALRADVQGFYKKWTVDLDDAQYDDGLFPWLAPLAVTTPESGLWSGSGPAWADAGIICPWAIYDIYGDRRQLAAHYPAMVRQIEWYRSTSRPNLLPPSSYKCLGDWLNHDAPIPNDVFRTAFFAYSTGLVARAAAVLGKIADAARYGELHAQIKAAFRATYVAVDGRILGHTQSGYAFALAFDLLNGTQAVQAATHLVANIRDHDWHPTTGLEGTLPMMLMLAKIGRNDVAYRLLHNEAFPSWNFSIKNGATTIWERWDSWTPERGFGDANMNSFNHFSLGAVYQWMAENIGGIRKDEPAYKRLVIAPVPGGNLTSARVSHECVRGLIQTDWQLTGDVLDLTVIIPANTSATVILPAPDVSAISEGGRPLDQVDGLQIEREAPGQVFVRAGSGCYQFQIQHPVIAGDPHTAQ